MEIRPRISVFFPSAVIISLVLFLACAGTRPSKVAASKDATDIDARTLLHQLELTENDDDADSLIHQLLNRMTTAWRAQVISYVVEQNRDSIDRKFMTLLAMVVLNPEIGIPQYGPNPDKRIVPLLIRSLVSTEQLVNRPHVSVATTALMVLELLFAHGTVGLLEPSNYDDAPSMRNALLNWWTANEPVIVWVDGAGFVVREK